MNETWTTVKLGDLVEITSSKRIKMADYVDNGVPFYRSKEIIERAKGNNISTKLFISENHFNAIDKRFGSPSCGDILLSSVGTLGVPYRVNLDDRFYFKDGNLTWFRNYKPNIDDKFLFCWLNSSIAKRKFDEVMIGSTQKALTIISLKSIEIALPPLAEQKAIASVLGALNDKIENNTQINKTLEEMARAIFKSWFVDFDPVHAKAAGNAPAHMNAETAALFPSSFGDNGLPAGWKASKFEDLIEFKNGYAFKSKEISKDFKTNFAIFKMGHIKVGGGFNDSCKTDYLISDASQKMKKYILETGDVLMSMTDMKDNVRLLGHTALFYEQNVNFLVNQRVGLIKAKKEITNYPYIYCLTNNKTFLNEIRKRANSGVQVNLSTDGIKTTPTIMPPLSLMAKFGSLSYPIFERIFSSLKENQSLAELRDFLLPKLMSGEIRVKDAEREVETAV